jgi:hypothetical protein
VAALKLVRGQPFAGTSPRRYAWADVDRQAMISAIVDVAHEVSQRAQRNGDAAMARHAAAVGLLAEPGSEALWRDRLRAEWMAGNPAGIEEMADRLTVLSEELGYSTSCCDVDPRPPSPRTQQQGAEQMPGNVGKGVSSETIRSSSGEASMNPPTGPPSSRRPLLVTLLVLAVLASVVLVAVMVITRDDEAVPDPPPTTAAPSPSVSSSTTTEPATPEEAAIASAETVYREYLRVSDEITTAGNGEVAALGTVAVGEALSQAQVAAQNYQLAGITRVGVVQLAALTPSTVNLGSDPAEVVLDACLDVSETDLIGPDGESVTNPGDPDRLAATAYVRDYPDRGGWLVARIVAEGQPC